MCIYATKSDLKNTTGVDTSNFALVSLKLDVDELDVEKVKKVPSDLNSLKSKVEKLDDDKCWYMVLLI